MEDGRPARPYKDLAVTGPAQHCPSGHLHDEPL